MHVRHEPNETILELETATAKKFAGTVLEHAEELSSPIIELATLIRTGQYAARDQFRQPPHAFDEGAPYAPGIKTGGKQ